MTAYWECLVLSLLVKQWLQIIKICKDYLWKIAIKPVRTKIPSLAIIALAKDLLDVLRNAISKINFIKIFEYNLQLPDNH